MAVRQVRLSEVRRQIVPDSRSAALKALSPKSVCITFRTMRSYSVFKKYAAVLKSKENV